MKFSSSIPGVGAAEGKHRICLVEKIAGLAKIAATLPPLSYIRAHDPRSKSSKVVFLRLLRLVSTAVQQDAQISVALLRYLAKDRAVPGRYLLQQPPAASSSTVRGGLQPMP
jgi:hypothetical protein